MAQTKRPAVAFVTLGCPKNEVDSDRMKATLAPYFEVDTAVEDADVLVVNTCSFIQAATEESIQAVLEAAGEWVPERAGRKLVVAGCMASRYGDSLASELPEVDAFVTVSEEDSLVAAIGAITGVTVSPASSIPAIARTAPGPSAYLLVADGCHRTCSFCTIPAIRGPYRSRPLGDLVDEAQALVAGGAREVVLIGQDISAYGRDLKTGETLADVVRAVAAVPGLDWLRLMYVQPEGISDDLLNAMRECTNVCHYLDMPLQHASRHVLRDMRRSGDAESFLELIGRVRDALPDVVLRTTLISGFPGETRADARILEEFVARAELDYVGVFVYSQEDGTTAGERTDQVPMRTRRARAQRLRDIADRVGFRRAAQRVSETLSVLVEGTDEEGVIVGRWQGQAPEVDGLVLLDTGTPGEIVQARVVDALGYDLEAEVIRS